MSNRGESTLKKRLEMLKRSIKSEPICNNSQYDGSLYDPFEDDYSNQPSRINRQDIFEPLREQFLNKNLSAQEVIDKLQNSGRVPLVRHDDPQIGRIYGRSLDINNRLREQSEDQHFYALVPKNISNTLPIPNECHSSPLVQSNHNSLYSFQAHRYNAQEVMIESNPYRNIPYQVQTTARRIGANLEDIQYIINENQRQEVISFVENDSNEQKVDDEPQELTQSKNPTVVIQETIKKDVEEKATQTTDNTGGLRFEIDSNEFAGLSEAKKRILLEFMDAFNIRDKRENKAIKERLEHRIANQISYNRRKQPSTSCTYGPPI